MKRLTEKIGNTNCVKGCGSNCKYGFQHCRTEDWENCKTIDDVIDKLAQYEELEEQGLLLQLPCKIGSDVWEIERQFWIDRKGCKDCIYFGNDGLGDYCDYDEDIHPACTKIVPKKFNIRMLDDFGKTVFLMQAEAEAKLKELRGGENESSN